MHLLATGQNPADHVTGSAEAVGLGLVVLNEGVSLVEAMARCKEWVRLEGDFISPLGVHAGTFCIELGAEARVVPETLRAADEMRAVTAGAVNVVVEPIDIGDVDVDLVDAVLVMESVFDERLITKEVALGHSHTAAVTDWEVPDALSATSHQARGRHGGGGQNRLGVDPMGSANRMVETVDQGDGHGGRANGGSLDLGRNASRSDSGSSPGFVGHSGNPRMMGDDIGVAGLRSGNSGGS